MVARGDCVVNQATQGLPGFWRFAWLFLMQPVTLGRLLRGVGVDPRESLRTLLRRRRSPAENQWLLPSAQLLMFLLPTAAILSRRLSPVSWRDLALVLPLAALGAVLLALENVGLGVYSGIAVGAIAAPAASRGGSLRWAVVVAACIVVPLTARVLVDGRFIRIASPARLPLSPLEMILEALALALENVGLGVYSGIAVGAIAAPAASRGGSLRWAVVVAACIVVPLTARVLVDGRFIRIAINEN